MKQCEIGGFHATLYFHYFFLIKSNTKIKKQQAVRAQSDFAPLIRE
jgi:hypothetical protein